MSSTRTSEPILTEIKVWMARRRLNQSELAASIGEAQSWVSKRLAGKVSLTVEDLLRVAGALDVPVEAFFRLGEQPQRLTRDSVQNRYMLGLLGIHDRAPLKAAA